MSEGLAQSPYVAARVGFEPATFRTQGIAVMVKDCNLIRHYLTFSATLTAFPVN